MSFDPTWATRLASNDLRDAFEAGLEIAEDADAEVAVPLLVTHLADPHPLLAMHVRFVLRELGDAALAPLIACYDERPAQRAEIAEMFGFLGPRALAAAERLRRDDYTAALREIVGPWDADPEDALPYVGEAVRLDWDGPPPIEDLGMELWLQLVEGHAENAKYGDDWDLWDRSAWQPEHVKIDWCPDQIAIGRRELLISLFDFDRNEVVTTTLVAEGAAFTKQELLWKLLDAQHRLGRCNDRIFEGLSLDEDGGYYLSTGS